MFLFLFIETDNKINAFGGGSRSPPAALKQILVINAVTCQK